MRELKFLATSLGVVPFDQWYDSLKDKRSRRIIAGKLRRLQDVEFRNYKSVGEGVFELRIFHGSGYRVYFGFEREQIIIVVAGGDKNSQSRDINKAILLWREYKNAV